MNTLVRVRVRIRWINIQNFYIYRMRTYCKLGKKMNLHLKSQQKKADELNTKKAIYYFSKSNRGGQADWPIDMIKNMIKLLWSKKRRRCISSFWLPVDDILILILSYLIFHFQKSAPITGQFNQHCSVRSLSDYVDCRHLQSYYQDYSPNSSAVHPYSYRYSVVDYCADSRSALSSSLDYYCLDRKSSRMKRPLQPQSYSNSFDPYAFATSSPYYVDCSVDYYCSNDGRLDEFDDDWPNASSDWKDDYWLHPNDADHSYYSNLVDLDCSDCSDALRLIRWLAVLQETYLLTQ